MLVLRLQIASIIIGSKLYQLSTDCSIRVSRSFAAIFKVLRDLFFFGSVRSEQQLFKYVWPKLCWCSMLTKFQINIAISNLKL